MSGLLRRIQRSRTAGAGEAPPEGQAAAPDDAPTAAGPPAAEAVPAEPAAVVAPARPVPAADPGTPAGLEPAEAPLRPPAGRRGRLRRRLRYLRRARELMLRDLGGLLYEIHRTGGGRVEAHATVVGAKVQRIAGLDAEARALEAALAAPRGDALVFQPGIGGTCEACGELYGSGARFCSSCGTPTFAATPLVPEMPAAPVAPAADEAPAKDDVHAEDAAPTKDDAPAVSVPPGDEAPTRAMAAVAEPPADGAAAPDPDAARNGRDADGVPDRPSPDPLAPEESRP